MKKNLLTILAIVLTISFTHAQQTNFSGSYGEPELEMINGIQYSNAVATKIKVTQNKESIKLERTSAGTDGDVTNTETIALNGKESTRLGKSSKRTIRNSANWSKDRKTL